MTLKTLLPQVQRQLFVALLELANYADLGVDAPPLVKIVHQLCPDLPVAWQMEAVLQMSAGHYRRARQTLEEADARMPGQAMLKALLAITLFVLGDATWEAYANETRALQPGPEVLAVLHPIEALLKRRGGESDSPDAETPSGTPGAIVASALGESSYPYFGLPC